MNVISYRYTVFRKSGFGKQFYQISSMFLECYNVMSSLIVTLYLGIGASVSNFSVAMSKSNTRNVQ